VAINEEASIREASMVPWMAWKFDACVALSIGQNWESYVYFIKVVIVISPATSILSGFFKLVVSTVSLVATAKSISMSHVIKKQSLSSS
jgi:hypothetical protein